MTAHAPVIAHSFSSRRTVGIWLLAIAALVVAMLAVGGLTRLTGSGLSITEWDPIVGAIPPLSHADWEDAFHKYQQIPQYRLENAGMTLEAFKGIFWWEWIYRFLGRFIGIAFFAPFVWFASTGAIGRKDWGRMLVLFALGGLQGFVGWWMVESGLEVRVVVSQYRLAIHLGMAVLLLGALLWVALEYVRPPLEGGPKRAAFRGGVAANAAYAFVALVFIQMLLGAIVAGLHAGLVYNTWPLMDGRFGPEHPFAHGWISFFEDPGLAQFDHRMVAYAVMIFAYFFWQWIRTHGGAARRAADTVLVITSAQVVLGVITLLFQTPVALAALHQVVAALLFCAAVWQAYELRASPFP